jgi:5-methylcytosine-specific restriction endonuclease McrA
LKFYEFEAKIPHIVYVSATPGEYELAHSTNDIVHSINKRIAVPDILTLRNYDQLPKRDIKYSRESIIQRDKYICGYCGKKFKKDQLTIDHILPKSFGGKNTWKNTITSCKACNNNNLYLKNLHKIAYLKKNNNNKLCIELRKRFEKISKLEELYKLETTNCKIFKDSLKTNPSIYNETKKKLCNFFKKKRDLQKQIILEKNKLLNKDYSYVCLFKTIDV